MKIGVRPVVSADEAAWLELFRDYIAFYEATVPDDVIALTWERLLSRADNMMALVATDEAGRAVGIAALVFAFTGAPFTITMFGLALFWCSSDWNCCVNAPPISILLPVYGTPSTFPSPFVRRSNARPTGARTKSRG